MHTHAPTSLAPFVSADRNEHMESIDSAAHVRHAQFGIVDETAYGVRDLFMSLITR
jgi:hypothetical protein